MSLGNYLANHLCGIAEYWHSEKSAKPSAEPTLSWLLCASARGRRKWEDGGDSDYHGDGIKPFWQDANPLWLIPQSEAAREAAHEIYEKQATDFPETNVPPLVDRDQENVFEDEIFALDTINLLSGEKPFPEREVKYSVVMPSWIAKLWRGRWFRLSYPGEDPLHVWINTVRGVFEQIVTLPLPPSVVKGLCPAEKYIAAFSVQSRGADLGRSDPPYLAFTDSWQNNVDFWKTAQVRWQGDRSNFSLPLWIIEFPWRRPNPRTEDPAEATQHTIALRATANNLLRLAYGRRFSVPPDSKLSKALGPAGSANLTVHVRQEWAISHAGEMARPTASNVDKNAPLCQVSVFIDSPSFVRNLGRAWNERIASAVESGLRIVRRGAATSCAPEFRARGGGAPVQLEGAGWLQIYDIGGLSPASLKSKPEVVLRMTGIANSRGDFAEDQDVNVTLSWQALRITSGASLTIDGALATRHKLPNFSHAGNDDGTWCEWFIETLGHPAKSSVLRDGALELYVGGNVGDSILNDLPSRFGRFRLRLHSANRQAPFFWWHWSREFEAEDDLVLSYVVEDLRLPVTEIRPGGQDLLPGEEFLAPASAGGVVEGAGFRREPALVIPTLINNKALSVANDGYFLVGDESINVAQSLSLRLTIERHPIAANPTPREPLEVVVLDAEPQVVAAVRYHFLQPGVQDEGTAEVARRSPLSEEKDGWEVLDDDVVRDGFEMLLPAQGLGEQAVKARDDFPENELAAARLAPPTLLRIAPERLEKRYVAVPWNHRRLFGLAGEPSPGVPLREARFEMLYGLEAHLKAPGILLAELAAKLGELPVPVAPTMAWNPTKSQLDAFDKSWRAYLEFFKAWLSRIAVLEAGHEATPLAPLELKEGVEYHARIRAAVINDGQIAKPPQGAQIAWPLRDPDPEPDLSKNVQTLFHVAAGLKGGAYWGFEALPIYREYWRHHERSSSGELNGLAFSSVGGWSRQTARFAYDKTIIQASVSMGRTHVYAVERIGRIGVFWHKAKHVILYERAAAASLQFYDEQNPHLGRPLLRKVQEYIEILEPERRYPDFPGQDKSGPGSVRACIFRSRILPVNSAWGRNVFRPPKSNPTKQELEPIGWEIPVWKPGLDARVYPKPQILLFLAASEESGLEEIPAAFDEPQVLRFYTDTRERDDTGKLLTAAVHEWPPIAEIDFTLLPEPELPDIRPALGAEAAALDVTMPDAQPVPPGFERFTFRVHRSEVPADVAGVYFADARITGRLRNVTMMRCQPNTKSATAWWDGAVGVSRPAKALAAMVRTPKDSICAQAANGFVETVRSLRTNPQASVNRDTFIAEAARWFGPATRGTANAESNVFQQLAGEITKPPRLHHLPTVLWDNLANSGAPYALQTWAGKIAWREVLEGVDGIIERVVGFIRAAIDKIIEEITALVAQGQTGLGTAKEAVDRFASILEEFTMRMEWTLDAAFEIAREAVPAAQGKIAQGLEARVATFCGEIRKRIAALRNEVQTVDAARQSLRVQIPQSAGAVLTAIGTITDDLGRVWDDDDWRTKTNALRTALAGLTEAIRDELLRVLDSAPSDELSTFLAAVDTAVVEKCGELEASVQTAVSEAFAKLQQISVALLHKFEEIARDLEGLVSATTGLAIDFAEVLKADIDRLSGDRGELRRTLERRLKTPAASDEEEPSLLEYVTAALIVEASDLLVGEEWSPGPAPASDSVYALVKQLDTLAGRVQKWLLSRLLPLFAGSGLEEALGKLFDVLDSAAALEAAIASGDPGRIIDAAQRVANDVNAQLGQLAGEVADLYRRGDAVFDAGGGAIQSADQVLRNARSIWEEFTAPGMGFNRKTLALVVRTDWRNLDERLGLTPCIARVKEFGQQLEGLGLRLPVVGLSNRLLPPLKAVGQDLQKFGESLLERFGFSDLISDIGGLRLTKLLPGLAMPNWARDKIKITHGFDKERLSAWVEAKADVAFDDRKTLMRLGPLLVSLDKGHFEGSTRIEADADGRMTKVASGRLTGDWHITFGGTPFMIYRQLVIRFENGKLDFDLDPKRIETPGLLKLLSDASSTLFEDDGFKFGIVQVGQLPVGVRADLEIGPVDASGGVSGITGLLFGGFFELRALDDRLRFDFSVATGFHFGRQEKPFNLQVMILGGGGYFDAAFLYKPATNNLTVDVALSVHASASLRIDQGWISGGVAIYLGLEAEYHKKPETRPAFNASLFIMLEGWVDILSLITVHLLLRLTVTFRSLSNGGNELVGSGLVCLTIRICRFVKIRVRKTYTKVIARSGGGQAELRQPEPVPLAASPMAAAVLREALPAALPRQPRARDSYIDMLF